MWPNAPGTGWSRGGSLSPRGSLGNSNVFETLWFGSWEKKTWLPTKIECYASSGLLIKTLHFKEVKDYGGGVRRPSVIETDSPLQEGYRSIMIFAGIKQRELPDEAFTLSFLPRVESLR